MGRISDEELNATSSSNSNQNDSPYYWYFGLAKEGDSAIVRIMDNSREDLEPLATHPVKIKGKYRRVSCLRDTKEPLELCPLCAAEAPREKKVYIHLIEYITAADGSVIPTPRVWERPTGYINELKEYMADYAPLSDNVFKIKRTGQGAGTRYALIPLNPATVDMSKYPKDESFFANYKALGVNVQVRDAENIIKGMSDGTLTFEVKQAEAQATPVVTTLTPNAVPEATVQQTVETPVSSVVPPVVTPSATADIPNQDNISITPVTPVAPTVAPVVPPVTPVNTATNGNPWSQPAPRRTYTPSTPVNNSAPASGFRPIRNV